MKHRHPVAVGATAVVAAAGPIMYPAWLALRTRGRRADPPTATAWPSVTVVVAAYREAEVIAAKVADARANGYPGHLDVVVVADDEETAAAARASDALVVGPGERLGKSLALNLGVAATTGEIVVFTDANARLGPLALQHLARWFADPAVGAVAGAKQVTGWGEGLYWRYESWIKARETLLGSTVGMVGELCAVRRDDWRDLPAVPIDDLWIALDLVERGRRVVYEPAAVAVEPLVTGLGEDWERRTRNLSGLLDVAWRRRRMLRPGSGVAAQLWGHKLLRSTVGPVAHLALLVTALRAMRRRPAAQVFVACHVVAAVSVELTRRGRQLPRPLRLAHQVAFLQAVALGGVVRFARGDHPSVWPKPDRRLPFPTEG